MPSPTFAIDLIKTALRLKGVLAIGETPNADEATDGLRALNDVLETWSTESYAVYGSLASTFALVGGQASYSMGPGGDWETPRPQQIDAVTVRWQGVDFTLEPWTQDEYQSVAVKAIASQVPQRFVFVNDAPLARVLLYPTPSTATTITINYPRLLTQVPDVNSAIVLPQGYVRALQYAVAEELGPQYGSPIDLSGAARASLALIKRANRQSPIAGFDSTLTGARPRWASIYG